MSAKLVVIVGETASGKTALAIELAKHFNGEVICADSRTIYRGMDIGTAKPTAQEQAGVPHHLLDVIEPGQDFNASEFKRLALESISDISGRGKLPIMVGGTGLYIDSVIFDYSFRAPANPKQRAELMQLSVEEMQARLREQGIPLPENARNPRHLLRALESGGQVDERKPLRDNTLVLGLQPERAELEARVAKRVEAMFDAGFIEEARQLGEHYGWGVEALQIPGYKEAKEYLDGSLSLEAAKQATQRAHLQLAKRQRTWFKRNKSIHYIRKQAEAVDLVTSFLNT